MMQNKKDMDNQVSVSMAYAPTDKVQLYLDTTFKQGTTIIEALQKVGWLDEFLELKKWCEINKDKVKTDNKAWRVGVFSQKKPLNYVLKAHDRVEVYRPLSIDPMKKRQKRAVNK